AFRCAGRFKSTVRTAPARVTSTLAKNPSNGFSAGRAGPYLSSAAIASISPALMKLSQKNSLQRCRRGRRNVTPLRARHRRQQEPSVVVLRIGEDLGSLAA